MARIGKGKGPQTMEVVSGILDSIGSEVVIARGSDCELAFVNKKGRDRLELLGESPESCKAWLAEEFSGICQYCPLGAVDVPPLPVEIEMTGSGRRLCSVRIDSVRWTDGRDAVLFEIRDISDERSIKDKYFSLAFLDQVTGLPNRQKLREDFDSVAENVVQGKTSGALAIINIDEFKTVNKIYGHSVGDILLKCLSEHIESIDDFRGRLYRLGGDEFVLLFTNESDRFVSEHEMERFYRELLSQALGRYTIQNMDMSCTLSIGVSLFPRHGESYSDILRRADIALSRAKGSGKNRMEFFEGQYDEAIKLKDVYISVQPFLNRAGRTFGYELVDIDEAGNDDGTINLTGFNRTLDALGFSEISGNAKYLIPFNDAFLNSSMTNGIPRDKFIVSIKPPRQLTDKDRRKLSALKKLGFEVAITRAKSQALTKELLDFADYCKFDSNDENTELQRQIIARNPEVIFIATNVDTHTNLARAEKAGFKLFQGFYFNHPPYTKKTKDISPLKLNYFRLIRLTATDSFVDFNEISEIISSDVAMSYKLLKLLNSASVGLRNVSSVAMAVTYLGEENLKTWICLMALRGVAEDKPLELVRLSLIRARFGELLAPHMGHGMNDKHIFLMGMLSLMDVALDISRQQLLDEISVADDIRMSMLSENGLYSRLLRFFEDYEKANWDNVIQFSRDHSISSQVISECYMEAVRWYNNLETQ